MKRIKWLGWGLAGALLIAALGYIILRYADVSGYPLTAGGGQVSPSGLLTARSLAIIERPFFGREHRYYRFELREGGDSGTGSYGRLLREVTMEPLPDEEFLMPRGRPAFEIKWSEDNAAVTFAAQSIELTLRK